MDTLNSPNDDFDFNTLVLTTPISLNSGNHFIKYYLNDGPLYIQPPKCIVKKGMIKATKRIFLDLMFTTENDEFIRWLENLEVYSRKFIYDNREKWFESELDENDIENSFTSPLKTYKSGKYYILRVSIPTHLGKTNLKIYDEQENVLDLDNISENDKVITALEIQGIKCSPRTFQIEIELKQLLKINQNNIFEKCVLGKSVKSEVALDKVDLPQTIDENVEEENQVLEETQVHEDEDTQVQEENPIQEEKIVQEENPIQEVTMKEESIEEPILDENIKLDVGNEDLKEIHLHLEEIESTDGPVEIDIPLENIQSENTLSLKKRNDIYYELYRDALKRAKTAKDLALSRFMEAKQIKNKYMLEDIDSDLEDESMDTLEE